MSSSSPTTSVASNFYLFTPPSSCLNSIFTLAPLGHANITSIERQVDPAFLGTHVPIGGLELSALRAQTLQTFQTILTNDAQGFNDSCYPPGFSATTTSMVISNGSNSIETMWSSILSGSTCPLGYTNLAQSVGSDGTTGTCCPAYPKVHLTDSGVDFPCVAEDGIYTYIDARGSDTDSVSFPWGIADVVHMRAVVVAWDETDLPLFTINATTSSSSSSSSSVPMTSTPTTTQPAPTASMAPPQPALSTGTKAGIAVGAILGALAVLLLTIGIIWRRRRRNRTLPPVTDTIEKPELPGEGIEHPQIASYTIYELPPQDKPSEVESRAAPVEMEGEWEGWEAPALVEVDMSRPAAASRNGDSGHHDRLQRLAKQSRVQG